MAKIRFVEAALPADAPRLSMSSSRGDLPAKPLSGAQDRRKIIYVYSSNAGFTSDVSAAALGSSPVPSEANEELSSDRESNDTPERYHSLETTPRLSPDEISNKSSGEHSGGGNLSASLDAEREDDVFQYVSLAPLVQCSPPSFLNGLLQWPTTWRFSEYVVTNYCFQAL